jgi:hypothetical protein
LNRVRGVGNKVYLSVNKKPKVEIMPKMEMFILPEGVKVPTSEVSKGRLAESGQFFEDFHYYDEFSQTAIDQSRFENYFLLVSALADDFTRVHRKYTFFHQKGASIPLSTGYSDAVYPSLNVWRAFAKDSLGSNKSRICYSLIVCPAAVVSFDDKNEEPFDTIHHPIQSLAPRDLQQSVDDYHFENLFPAAHDHQYTVPLLIFPAPPSTFRQGADGIIDISVEEGDATTAVTHCSDADLNSLELFEYEEPTHLIDEDAKEECPVCLNKFLQNELINRLPCRHIYHATCIRTWLKKNILNAQNAKKWWY